jgi:hypothetical protein
MTRFRPPGASLGDPASSGIDEYALWDAAYVLGSICSADRRCWRRPASPSGHGQASMNKTVSSGLSSISTIPISLS